ncbi:hypothetical protein [Aquitalea sp. USM4]|uniref:hypothetical protein n=1 Tax=Aquitalea sp. USM4 TaxID=1590041 RepID=UPI00103F7909|nr:hypothetical protein [Aquitalea sp. USM4]QBJ80549.1 hypothetical protein DKK66_20100 [Aquitalea sp. USM4]
MPRLQSTPLHVLLGMIKMEDVYVPVKEAAKSGDFPLSRLELVTARLDLVPDVFTSSDIQRTAHICRSAANYIIRSASEYGLCRIKKRDQAHGHTYEKVKP